MADDTKSGQVHIRENSEENLYYLHREYELNENADNNKEHNEEEYKSQEEEGSSSDYELSLREENIRLKSRLEQVKEISLKYERRAVKYQDELEREKIFTEKANKTIYNLMKDKTSLEEQLKRQPKNNKTLEDIIRKLEHEVYALEERLERQRKRYHHEHLLIYDDLKDERRKQFEWKQTYLRSQVSVMAFRRKLQLLKLHLRPEDHQELMKCLEIGLHDCDSDNEKSDDRKEQQQHRSYRSTEHDTRKAYEHEKPRTSHETYRYHDKYRSYNDSTSRGRHREYESAPPRPSRDTIVHNGSRSEETSYPQRVRSPDVAEQNPKVFIVEEKNRYGVSSKMHSPVETTRGLTSPHDSTYHPLPRIESPRDGHSVKAWEDVTASEHSASAAPYKEWHPYSPDNPGSRSSSSYRREDIIETSVSKAPTKLVEDYPLETEDYRFLELKFDNGLLQTEIRPPNQKSSEALPSGRATFRSLPVGTPLEQKKLWCLTCDGEVTNKLCGHSSLVIQEREKEFPCPTCSRIFNNRSHLKRHNMIHSGEKPWACTYCDKRFNRKSHLSRHILTHTGERPFKCPYCAKGFADNSDLKRHKQIHESTPGFVPIRPKETPPSASTTLASSATTTTTTTQALETADIIIPDVSRITMSPSVPSNNGNMTLTSTLIKKKSEAKFPCNKCGKVFTRNSHLTRHKLTHEQVKIFCDCGRMFRQKAHLQAHLPACKRKREAVEAKYLAGLPKQTMAVKEEQMRSPDQYVTEENFLMEYEDEKPAQSELYPRMSDQVLLDSESDHALLSRESDHALHSRESDHALHSRESDHALHSRESDHALHSRESDHALHSREIDHDLHSRESDHALHSRESDQALHSRESDHALHSREIDHDLHSRESDQALHSRESDHALHSRESDQALHSREGDHALHSRESDQGYDIKNVPLGIPPLIHDPL